MITIITGTPGAGKTLYTIEKLLQPLVGTSITYTNDQGEEVTAPRTVYTNINGLLLDHELIDGGENKGLRDWHKWAKPGSVIVFDEVQRHWKPRANGSAVPPDIEALETHRHMGVDFIIITQNVLLVDRNIHALAGRHLHVRRIASMPMAIVYEWDHVSRGLLYAKSLTKSPWRYSKKIFKLYKSAEVHTKQPRSIPGAVWFILGGLLLMGVMGQTTYARLTDRINGGKPAEQVKAATPAGTIGARPEGQRQSENTPQAPQAPVPAAAASAPVFAGCIASTAKCSCYDTSGNSLDREPEACRVMTRPAAVVLGGGTFPEHRPYPTPPPPPVFAPPEPDEGITPAQLRAAYRERRAPF